MPLPELAVAVAPPALQHTAVENGAGVSVSSAYRDSSPPCTEVNGREVIPHLVGPIARVGRVSDAESAVAIAPPALHAAIVQHCAGVVAPRADFGRSPPGTEVDCREVIAPHLADGVSDVSRPRPLTGPSRAVVAPALHAAVVQQGARVISAGSDVCCRPVSSQRSECEVFAHLVGPVGGRRCVALPELAVCVVAPALDVTLV